MRWFIHGPEQQDVVKAEASHDYLIGSCGTQTSFNYRTERNHCCWIFFPNTTARTTVTSLRRGVSWRNAVGAARARLSWRDQSLRNLNSLFAHGKAVVTNATSSPFRFTRLMIATENWKLAKQRRRQGTGKIRIRAPNLTLLWTFLRGTKPIYSQNRTCCAPPQGSVRPFFALSVPLHKGTFIYLPSSHRI